MYRRRKINIIALLIGSLSVVIIFAIAYAAFTGQLSISSSNVVSRTSNWDIHFENVSSITTSGTAKVLNNKEPQVNSNNPTQIDDYEASITSPNDSISFTFDVVNDGNYNAKITSISIGTPQCTSSDNASAVNMCNNLTYSLKYTGGASVQTNDVLYAKDKLSFVVELKFADITDPSLLPKSDVTISNLGITINFEQYGGALVNESGEVLSYRVYHQGDKITLNNEDYWVIENSGAGQDYVVALKDLPLTVEQVNTYGIDHISQYAPASIGTAYNVNGYGGISYYSSETCGLVNGVYVSDGCINVYENSEIKFLIDTWATNVFSNNELKEVSNFKARLIMDDEYQNIISYNWRYGNYCYFTMSPVSNKSYVKFIKSDGSLSSGSYVKYDPNYKGYAYYGQVYDGDMVARPVINVYKSALETNNNNNNE